MYEARQNKEKVSHTILSKKKEHAYSNFNDSNSKHQKLLPPFYSIQMCGHGKYKYDKRIVRFDPSEKKFLRRTKTFYGLLETLKNKQGPHVVPFASIACTIQKLGKENLSNFKDRIFTPKQFEETIKKELEVEEIVEYEEGWGYLKSIVNEYNDLYKSLESELKQIKTLKNDDESITIIKNIMLSLINLNPYATYGWATEGGAASKHLDGKGEKTVNLDEIRSLDDILKMKCFDFYAILSNTFNDMKSFRSFLQNMFINVPSEDIDRLINLDINDAIQNENLDFQIDIYAHKNEKTKLVEIANKLWDNNKDVFLEYLEDGVFLMKDACVTILFQNANNLKGTLNDEQVVNILDILYKYPCMVKEEEKLNYIDIITESFRGTDIYDTLIKLRETE